EADRGGSVPGGPVLPAAGGDDRRPPAPRAAGRHRRTGPLFPLPVQPGTRAEHPGVRPGGTRVPAGAPVAGERPRAAGRSQGGDAPHGRPARPVRVSSPCLTRPAPVPRRGRRRVRAARLAGGHRRTGRAGRERPPRSGCRDRGAGPVQARLARDRGAPRPCGGAARVEPLDLAVQAARPGFEHRSRDRRVTTSRAEGDGPSVAYGADRLPLLPLPAPAAGTSLVPGARVSDIPGSSWSSPWTWPSS